MDTTIIPLFSGLIVWGVIFLQAACLVLLALFFRPRSAPFLWVQKRALVLSFLVALSAFLGSLYYSEVVEFTPCLLCWYQRIFLYPQVFMLGYAAYKKDSNILPYALMLSGIGFVIALYHVALPLLEASSIICDVTSVVSCLTQYVNAFGYITIQMMSLTVFTTLILLAHIGTRPVRETEPANL